MKYIILLGDGMADEPIEQLGGKTPLQFAHTPHMDRLASMGNNGLLKTIPHGFHPGSEVANLSVLGFDLPTVFEGRGALEAASIGIEIEPNEMVMRCNLITVDQEKIVNHSAGHISGEEAAELISFLQKELGNNTFCFYNGVSYRHILKIKGGNKQLHCTPPHDVPGTPYREVMIKPLDKEAQSCAEQLNRLIEQSQQLLKDHPVNLKRISQGKAPANSIWPWSPGYRPKMKTLAESYGVKSGSVISAVDLIKGIGIYAGLTPIEVPGATGLWNTNYEGKVEAALKALRNEDFVFLHVEASDEAGHEGNVKLKVQTIEDLDRRVVKPILDELLLWNESVTIALLPDHPTPCSSRTHTAAAVPFVIYQTGNKPDAVCCFDEISAQQGGYGKIEGAQFMNQFMNTHSH